MKTSKPIVCLLGAVALIAASGAYSAAGFPEKSGYVIDSHGNVVRNSYGDCWRTGYWTPSLAIEECDPDLIKKEAMALEQLPTPAAGETKPPAMAEKPAVVPVAKPMADVYFNAETLFDFDMAVVKPEGQRLLEDKIVSGMKMHPEVEFITVTGHADFIGTEHYNQGLSERRANAVKAYLVKQGVDAGRIRVAGKGESEPNPQANTKKACKGMKGDRLIACLQPDRRVTVVSKQSEAM